MASQRLIKYDAEPVAAEFHASEAFFRGLKGPIGSGKSVACITEILKNAHEQLPSPDGVRRTRWAIIRNTYPELLTTTLKTWLDWVPEDICPVNRATPITARLKTDLEDGTKLDMEVIFLALDKPKDVKKLLSLELTGVFINEAREVPKAVVDGATSRVGRYPNKAEGGPTRACVIADTNPPDDDHWWYRLSEEERPDNWEFFNQPGALIRRETYSGVEYDPNPDAQNIRNLPNGYDYYFNQLGAKTEEWIKVYILGLYGTVEDGRPVYGNTYNDRLHCSPETILANPKFPLILGWDFGLTPACIIGQLYPSGRIAIIDELVSEYSGIKQFGRDVVRPYLQANYKGFTIGASIGDPAGQQGAQTDEQTCLQVLSADFKDGGVGIPTSPSPSNALQARLDAVNHFLTKLIDGKCAFYLSPKCKTLRKGFNGGYRFLRVQVAGDERFRDVPDKNRFSHPHDALQYLCQGAVNGALDTYDDQDFGEQDHHTGRSAIGGY
jgi:hypothetical protein